MIRIYKVGIYIRLSKEDDKDKNIESESITNQRNLIMEYINNNNLTLEKEYVDDGISGTTFNRPGFNELIKDIENKKINMVITKDLSRLGRDYIKSGYYLEEYFPLKKVRYVSLLDNIDTFNNNSNIDIAPFKALFNDMQSKDTSKKIRSILINLKKQGLFVGNSACYGYKKDKNDKHKLVIDNYSSKIVRKIYDMYLNNVKVKDIVDYLNNKKIQTPKDYKNNKNIHKWSNTSIYQILHNYMYTGNMTQGVQTKLSYKSNKRIFLDKSHWIIVPNTHESIISEEEYFKINNFIHTI
ncbi:MAG: recombinase family protein [Bacilli bacterium]|nr:recombinase family protein [Bacilli bacterium]